MCSACITISPAASKSAVEQSRRSLMLAEWEARISTAPISSQAACSEPIRTWREIGSRLIRGWRRSSRPDRPRRPIRWEDEGGLGKLEDRRALGRGSGGGLAAQHLRLDPLAAEARPARASRQPGLRGRPRPASARGPARPSPGGCRPARPRPRGRGSRSAARARPRSAPAAPPGRAAAAPAPRARRPGRGSGARRRPGARPSPRPPRWEEISSAVCAATRSARELVPAAASPSSPCPAVAPRRRARGPRAPRRRGGRAPGRSPAPRRSPPRASARLPRTASARSRADRRRARP